MVLKYVLTPLWLWKGRKTPRVGIGMMGSPTTVKNVTVEERQHVNETMIAELHIYRSP